MRFKLEEYQDEKVVIDLEKPFHESIVGMYSDTMKWVANEDGNVSWCSSYEDWMLKVSVLMGSKLVRV